MMWILDSRRTGSALTSVCELLNDDHISNSVSITGEAAEMLATSDATQILQNALHAWTITIAVNMQTISGQSPTFDSVHVKCIQCSPVSAYQLLE